MDWAELAEAPVPWVGNTNVSSRSGPFPFVVQTRLLFHRNFRDLPFLVSAAPAACAAMVDRALGLISGRREFSVRRLADCPPAAIRLLRERHFLPPRSMAFPGKKGFKYVAVAAGGAEWALVNEIEHMTFGRAVAGLADPETVDSRWAPPEDAETPCPWARSRGLGFLASDPARIGPGMSVEMLIHLPALGLSRRLVQVRNYLAAVGVAFLPAALPDPGGFPPLDAGSALFWLKSGGGLGKDVGQVYRSFMGVVELVLRTEREAQGRCLEKHGGRLRERVGLSLRMLLPSGGLGYADMLAHGSLARFGAYAGMADPGIPDILEELRIKAGTGHLAVTSGREMAKEEEDFLRANIVRSYLMTRSGEIT